MKPRPVYLTVIRSTIFFLSLLFIADRTIGFALKKLYFKQTKGDYYQTTYAIKSARQQLLIFGSSRASHHYVSPVFEKYTGMSTYNLGRDGRNVLYCETILSQVLSYHRPDAVILDVTPDEFSWKAGKEGQDVMVSALLPYAGEPVILKRIEQTNENDLLLSKIFWTYPYNSLALQIFGNYYGFLSGENNIKGYEPLLGNKVSAVQVLEKNKVSATKVKNDTALVNSFKNFLALAKKNSIICYVVVSPTNQLNADNCIPYLKKLTEASGCYFFDYSTLQKFKKATLFYDDAHLNNTGAVLFSNYFAGQLGHGLTAKL